VRYSVERGFEEPALIFARRLYAVFDTAIESLSLIPDESDDLAVDVNDRLVHSTSATGRLPRIRDISMSPGEG
jgi:hypothetical protein